MEFLDWQEFDFDRKKERVDYGPMGPKHPCWKEAKEEIAHLLEQAGRVYDQETVEQIAQNDQAWMDLIEEVRQNDELMGPQRRMRMMLSAIRKIKEDTVSQQRLDKLFGGKTKIK